MATALPLAPATAYPAGSAGPGDRLAGVVIECLDFREFIPRYDRPATLFYLDPPYWGSESLYGKELFRRADYQELVDLLGHLKGRFILPLNDRAEVRETFARFRLEPIQTTYTIVGQGRAKRARELLITAGRALQGLGQT